MAVLPPQGNQPYDKVGILEGRMEEAERNWVLDDLIELYL